MNEQQAIYVLENFLQRLIQTRGPLYDNNGNPTFLNYLREENIDYAVDSFLRLHVSINENENLILENILCGFRYHTFLTNNPSYLIKNNFPVHIFGNGCHLLQNSNSNVKGKFDSLEPYIDYMYHICIENFTSNKYISEKIINPLLCGTIPIYLGCKEADNYFPNQIIRLENNIQKDLQIIYNICKNPNTYLKKIDIEIVKHRINLIKNIDKIF